MSYKIFHRIEKRAHLLSFIKKMVYKLKIAFLLSKKLRINCTKAVIFALFASILIALSTSCLTDHKRFEKAMQTKNVSKGISAVKKLADPSSLKILAEKALAWQVREAAVRKITDQKVLERITEDDWGEVRIAAIEKLTNQSLLGKISIEDNDSRVRGAAVKKLTNESLLAKITVEDREPIIRHNAFKKVTMQSLLADIAAKSKDTDIRDAAFEKVTDQSLLTKIARAANDSSISYAAFEKVTEQYLLAEIALLGNWFDGEVRRAALKKLTHPSFLALLKGFENVPEGDHQRLLNSILPVIQVLSYPEVVNEVGEIENVKTNWSSLSQDYYYGFGSPGGGVRGSLAGSMTGERFRCSIKLKSIKNPLSQSWSTRFPERETIFSGSSNILKNLGFNPAFVIPKDLLEPVFSRLSQSVLMKIAITNLNLDDDFSIRIFAIEKLTDQTLLLKISMEDNDPKLRTVAVKKLTDQSVLAKIAVEDENPFVRSMAVEKLTDQSLLAKIAVEDEVPGVRSKAAEKLTDQSLLAKIAVEDENPFVRSVAVEKLTDQSLLAKIAVEDENPFVRSVAVEKLTDQSLLEKIIQEDKDNMVYSAASRRIRSLQSQNK